MESVSSSSTKLNWAELLSHKVAGHFEATLSTDESGLKMTGTGDSVDGEKKYTFTATLKRPGLAVEKVFALAAARGGAAESCKSASVRSEKSFGDSRMSCSNQW